MVYFSEIAQQLAQYDIPVKGCSEDEIAAVELTLPHPFPAAYREFLLLLGHDPAQCFCGDTVELIHLNYIQEEAEEIMSRNNCPWIGSDYLVFRTHQNYSFGAFKLSDGDDPEIFWFVDGDPSFETWTNGGRYSDYIKREFARHLEFFKRKHARQLQAQAPAPAPATPALLDNTRRMQLAQWLQVLRMGAALLMLVNYAVQYHLLQQLAAGQAVSEALADANDQRVHFSSIGQSVVALAALAALVAWCYRAYQNVHRLPEAHPEYSPGMAWAGWFIPILNLWYPYKIMLEIGQYIGGFGSASRPELRSRWDYLLPIWWALFILIIIASRISYFAGNAEPGTLPELLAMTRLLLASQVLTLLGAAATLAVLRTLAGPERALGQQSRHAQPASSAL